MLLPLNAAFAGVAPKRLEQSLLLIAMANQQLILTPIAPARQVLPVLAVAHQVQQIGVQHSPRVPQ